MVDFYFDFTNGILKNKLNIVDYQKLKDAESYYFDQGLRQLQEKNYFSTDPEVISYMHNYLFNSLYEWAGKYRLIDLERSEPALAGLSVKYYHYEDIMENINVVFNDIKRVNLSDLNPEEKIDYISDVVVRLWQIHPFRDCNTRTLIVFINQYCRASSLSFETNLLRNNIDYFRRSLVASAFEDKLLEVQPNKSYTLRIMKDAFKGNLK